MLQRAASKGKPVAPIETEAVVQAALAGGRPEGPHDVPDDAALHDALSLLQVWCWMRGMPPMDQWVALPRTTGAARVVADYEVYFQSLGYDVHTSRFVAAYPWTKVREPAPAELSLAWQVHQDHGTEVAAYRFLDLELELLEKDSARGKRRPIPEGFASWDAVRDSRNAQGHALGILGWGPALLRPPGKAPYPPVEPANRIDY